MIYTQEEKTKMDAVLQAFRSYIDLQEKYDVVYSQKAGYLRVLTGESCDNIYFPITGFADMLWMFTDDFLADEECRVGHYLKRDYDHVRSLLVPRLDTLKEYREEACIIMEEALKSCRIRCEQIREDRIAEIQHLEELLQALRASIL